MRKILIAMSIAVVSLMATDYSAMTFDELNALRGTVAVEDKEAFRTEMRGRIDAMSDEDRTAYFADRAVVGSGNGVKDGTGSGSQGAGGAKDGSGLGQGAGGGQGQGLRDGSGAGGQGVNKGGENR